MAYFRPLVIASDGSYDELQNGEVLTADYAVVGATTIGTQDTLRVVGRVTCVGASTVAYAMSISHTYSSFGQPRGIDVSLANNSMVMPRSCRGINLDVTNNSSGFFNNYSSAYGIYSLINNTNNTSAGGGIKLYSGYFTAYTNDANYDSSMYSYVYGVYGTLGSRGACQGSFLHGVCGHVPSFVICRESYGVYGHSEANTASKNHYGGYFKSDGSGGTRIGAYAYGTDAAFRVDLGLWQNTGNLVLGAVVFSGSEMLRVVGSVRHEGISYFQHTHPLLDSAYDLGTSSIRWRYGYFDDVKVGSINILGSGSPAKITPSNGFQLGEPGGAVADIYLGDIENAYTTTDIDINVRGGTVDVDTDSNQVDGKESFRVQHEGSSKFSVKRVDAVTDDACLTLGSYHIWVDSTGDLRIKSSAPTSDTDGVVVGSQS